MQSQFSSQHETRRAVFAFARRLADIARCSYGPSAKATVLRAHADATSVALTTSSGRLYEFMGNDEHPAAKVLFELVRPQVNTANRGTEGGHLTVMIASSLLLLSLESSELHHKMTSLGHSMAEEWVAAFWKDGPATVNVSFQDDADLLAVAMTSIGSKGLVDATPPMSSTRATMDAQKTAKLAHRVPTTRTSTIPLLAALTVEATLLTAPCQPGQRRGLIRQLPIVGTNTNGSCCVDGLLLSAPPYVDPRTPKSMHDARVLVFDIALEPINDAADANARVKVRAEHGHAVLPNNSNNAHSQLDSGDDTADGVGGLRGYDLSVLMQLAARVVELGISVVVCQRGVVAQMQEYLTLHGVLVIERISLLNIGSVQAITGATAISRMDVDVLREECVGRLLSVTRRTIGRSRMWLLRGCQPDDVQRPPTAVAVVTLALCAPNELIGDEISAAVSSGLSALEAIALEPVGLIGGGCAQYLAAKHIREKAASLSVHSPRMSSLPPSLVGVVGRAACFVAQALEECCCALALDQPRHETLKKLEHAYGTNTSGGGDDNADGAGFVAWLSSDGMGRIVSARAAHRQIPKRSTRCNADMRDGHHGESGAGACGESDDSILGTMVPVDTIVRSMEALVRGVDIAAILSKCGPTISAKV